jgi:hypothetical protein
MYMYGRPTCDPQWGFEKLRHPAAGTLGGDDGPRRDQGAGAMISGNNIEEACSDDGSHGSQNQLLH